MRFIRKFREEGCFIVYLDEIWLNINYVVRGDWVDCFRIFIFVFELYCGGYGCFVLFGKGFCLIIVDVGFLVVGMILGFVFIFELKIGN